MNRRLEFFVVLMLALFVFTLSEAAEIKKEPVKKGNASADVKKDSIGQDHDHAILTETLPDNDLAGQVRIDEELGSVVAMDTLFRDETGKEIKLETLFDKPVVLLPIFFSCTDVCGFLQADLARVLNVVDQVPGRDFNIITLSFSDDENEIDAAGAKKNYNNLIKREFPLEKWSYLTGDQGNIRKLTDSMGYYFIKKATHQYVHPSALIVLSKEGKIIRYLYGPNFLPFDVGMALNEAEKGKPGISIKRGVLSFCFDYDPARKTYAFKVFRIAGTVVLISLIGFIIFLLYPSKRDKKDKIVS
ncbi:MAG: copper transporter [Desulfobacterales bacterium RIFOXYA12_FULL_46_15]|nr:MAG: copper transporter [Desulfobacterales bacterium RIFOXYA12_FULL_46_15]